MTEDPSSPPLSPLPESQMPLPVAWKAALVIVLITYVGFAIAHLKLTPQAPNSQINYINAPDEAAHFLYIRCMAESHRIPVRGDAEYSTYEWHQPPLYYALAAPLFRLGPIAVRSLSIFFGLLSIICIFVAARWLFPRDPALPVTAAGFAALLPMRQAVYAAAGNDALIELMFSLTLLLIAQIHQRGFTTRRAVMLGVVLAAAMLTKATGLLLLPVAALAIAMLGRAGETRVMVIRGALVTGAIVVLLTAPWYIRNLRLYGELTPARAFMHEFEGTRKASDIIGKRGFTAKLWTGEPEQRDEVSRMDYEQAVVGMTFRTFWAAYTPIGQPALLGLPFMLPNGLYICALAMILVALAGFVRTILDRQAPARVPATYFIVFLATIILVKLAFLGFTWTFFQTQGRYIFPAMLPISILLAVGICGLVSVRYRGAAAGVALALMGAMSVAFLVVGVIPAYSQ